MKLPMSAQRATCRAEPHDPASREPSKNGRQLDCELREVEVRDLESLYGRRWTMGANPLPDRSSSAQTREPTTTGPASINGPRTGMASPDGSEAPSASRKTRWSSTA
jgi:hypothetical protein